MATEMATMTAMTMMTGTKSTAMAAAWQERGVEDGGSAATAMAGAHTTINN